MLDADAGSPVHGAGRRKGSAMDAFFKCDLQGVSFTDVNLAKARFTGVKMAEARLTRSSLAGAVLRGVDVQDAEIDAPWLLEGDGVLTINGVNVAPLVDAELNRRFPGRELRLATDPEGLQAAWEALQRSWNGTLQRVAAMPEGTVDVSVAGEWSFAQTLRHLVMATDTWLRGAILRIDQPYHPIGQPNAEYAEDGYDPAVFDATTPSYGEVLEVRAERVAMVRDHLATATAELLAETRQNPWAPAYPETVLSCLHTIVGEEWEHLRYAVRDLDSLAAAGR